MGGVKTKMMVSEMKQFHISRSLLLGLSALSLVACASNATKAPPNAAISELNNVDQSRAIPLSPEPKKRLRDRLAGGAVEGTLLAAKGTVIAAKGAVSVTSDGAERVAKGAVLGARIGGKAAVETGEIIVKGTRRTMGGVRNGMTFITTAPAAKDAASPVGNKTFTDAALSPLSDFNIRKRERPDVLLRLEDDDIYQLDSNVSCEWYDVRIEELDDVLGDDYDVPREKVSTLKKVGKNGHGAAISGAASAAGTYIPGRSLIRALSGAKARQKKTREIYQKGVARRSFLKGVAKTEGCSGY